MSISKKIVVIGGTGLIGSRTVALLRAAGIEAVVASPATGVDTVTGQGLAQVLDGAEVVVDLSNAPSFEDKAVLSFFETSGRNLLEAEALAKVRHHVTLSIVGTDRMTDNGYFRAKVAQENLVRQSGIPYTIVRSTQFFEFLSGIADAATAGKTVRLPVALFQPIAADDVAAILADMAMADPLDTVIEIAGPERAAFDETVRRYLSLEGDTREVERDADARYFGGRISELSLVPLEQSRLGRIDLDAWFRRRGVAAHPAQSR